MSFVHCCTTSLPPATQRVISASGHSNPVSCSSGFPLLTLYVSCLFSLKTMYCQLSPSREACVCSLLTIRSLTIFCCHSLLYSFWQHGFLDPSVSITMLKCRFRDPLRTSWIRTRVSGQGMYTFHKVFKCQQFEANLQLLCGVAKLVTSLLTGFAPMLQGAGLYLHHKTRANYKGLISCSSKAPWKTLLAKFNQLSDVCTGRIY